MYKVVDNFLTYSELRSISRDRNFSPFKGQRHSLPVEGYRNKILEEAETFADLSNAIQIEEWFHNPAFSSLPGKHYDKDERLFRATGNLQFPLCSCILYVKVENLVGSELIIDSKYVIVPKTNRLVLISPGVEHEVTPWVSGTRVSVNINPWDRYLHGQEM